MKNFIIYDNKGKILRTGTCLDSDINYQNGQGGFVLEGKANYTAQYIENGEVVDLPEKPTGDYFVFNYDTKEWEFDTVSADLKAKKKRDKLLAEGPDRINPMWWSTMTQEEQQSWTEYRQALLDITSQPNYPQEIIWPIKP